ncbi:hypothetical protein [Paenibacillus sp. N3.4]|uniref:hypothetical protein n=1 Tax=Paenibacillus sp. N3.4 TaxID=2603222 RepID=UPI0011C7451F|nr:hypothetical protein [Paenibacillus sp. N3.4]TXK84475.1 hypothetical protein FU659_08640 [Paenibacillus sp. N3.4]
MTCLINNVCGNRNLFPGQPELTMGTIYAVADHITGPYTEPEDAILIASRGFNGLSCRSVVFGGTRYLFYTQTEREPRHDGGRVTMGTITTPKRLEVIDGKLGVYDSGLEGNHVAASLIESNKLPKAVHSRILYETHGNWTQEGNELQGQVKTSWARYAFDCVGTSFIYEADVQLMNGIAIGLTFRQNEKGAGSVVLCDFEKQQVTFGDIPQFRILDGRSFKLVHGKEYRLKIVAKGEFMEVYIDEQLILQFVSYAENKGFFGLIVDRGHGIFKEIQARELVI